MVKAVEGHLLWQHISCCAHALQIAVKAGLSLPYIADLMASCCKLVGHFEHSNRAKASLEDMPLKLGLPPHKLLQDVATRWNSTYEMIVRVIEQKTGVLSVG